MIPYSFTKWTVLLMFFANTVCVHGGKWDSRFVQKTEADHWGGRGKVWTHPPVVEEFREFLAGSEHEKLAETNDMDVHHKITAAFCKHRKECLWQEYQAVFDALREPFKGLYDPAPGVAFSLDDLRKRGKSALQDCSRVSSLPSAREFLTLMQLSTPIVFEGARHWPAIKKWTYEYLVERLGEKYVVASVSPHGYFDVAEDAKLWERRSRSKREKAEENGKFNATEEVIVARPGHVSFPFKTFVEQLRKANKDDHPSLYLEYFPLHALAAERVDCGPGTEECPLDEGAPSSILDDVENLDFANFMFPRQRLFWMGAGKTVGALHFDRNENLMVVLRGKKRFLLIEPNASSEVYADAKLRSASYAARYDAENERIHVWRDLKTLRKEALISVYSPVNISAFDKRKFPKIADVKAISCDVGEGDVIYVPSHWWHEVISFPDDEGKTIGMNFFYEPLWNHYQFNSTSNVGVINRYYNYVLNDKTALANVCTEDTVCFREDKES